MHWFAAALAALGCAVAPAVPAQQLPNLDAATRSVMAQWPAETASGNDESLALLLHGIATAWYDTADGADYKYIQQSVDAWLRANGPLDHPDAAGKCPHCSMADAVLLLYRVTGDKRYFRAASTLRASMLAQNAAAAPGAASTLTSVSANGPFLAGYAQVFQKRGDFAQITRQFVAANAQLRTGGSELDRAMYMAAMVDTLQAYPADDPGRSVLSGLLNSAAGMAAHRHPAAGASGDRNTHASSQSAERSADCLLVYAMAKGVRLEYLPVRYRAIALRTWQRLKSQPRDDTAKGAEFPDSRYDSGAYLLAAGEIQLTPIANRGAHQEVLVDGWFNSQQRASADGQRELFHYKWTDYRSSGFSLFGHMFRSYGMATGVLAQAPAPMNLAQAPAPMNLARAQYYIIASPDNVAKNPDPHYMTVDDARQVEAWVRRGGSLVLMENDPANADIEHLDILADAFGLHFNNQLVHAATEYDYPMGELEVKAGGPLFHSAHLLYMKDTCSLTVSHGAHALLTYKGDTFMATARYGKGMVYAVTDPWLYNEYTDGRKLPPQYDNFAAGMELVRWLIAQHARR